MKRITAFILTFVLMFTFSITVVHGYEKPTGVVYGKIVEIHDGDSFTILTSSNELHKIKIAGIDVSRNPDAYTFLQGYLKGENARVLIQNETRTYTKPFSYGVVYLGSSNYDIAYDLLALGYVAVNTKTCPTDKKRSYTSYENTAKYAKVGIWKQ